MALYFHMFISVSLALAAVVQETRGYTTSYPTNGSELSMWTCEDDTLSITCDDGYIQIKYANYGRSDRSTCGWESGWSDNCVADQSLTIVKDMCNGNKNCEIQASNYIFVDSCPGTEKYLEVRYSCEKATIRLLPGTSSSSLYNDNPRGLIEVKVGGEWGPLCGSHRFASSEAKVVCRQLGYSYHDNLKFAQDTFDIDTQYDVTFYFGLNCRGYEESLTECDYSMIRGPADLCATFGENDYAGVECEKNAVTTSEVSFNYFGWLVLAAIFVTIFMVIRRYRQRGGLCNKRDQMTQHTAVHTTNNVQGVVIPPPSGALYPPPPPGTYPSQPQANYQYQPPSANTPPVPQYGTGLPPKEGAPPYSAQNTGNPYPQGAPYPLGGVPYPPQGAGAPYLQQGGAPYPPQPAAAGAPYPPQGGAPYPPQNAGAPYQSQYQGASAPPQGGAPTSEASAPAFNPAFPPADYIPDTNNAAPAMPPPSYESAVEQ